jgi:hypothetical protein
MKYNDNTIFLLPLLGIDLKIFTVKTSIKTKNGYKTNRFYNSYITDDLIDIHRDEHIYVCHYGTQDVLYAQFEETIELYPNYKDSYEIAGGNLIVRIFEVPDKFKAEYHYFKEGKFSKFSKDAQRLCVINSIATYLAGKYNIADILPGIFKTNITKKLELKKDWENYIGESLSETDELWIKKTLEEESLTEELRKKLQQEFCNGIQIK